MSVRIEFHGGPADGAATEYRQLEVTLPSLYWRSDDEDSRTAVYRRTGDAPDPATGAWRYTVRTS